MLVYMMQAPANLQVIHINLHHSRAANDVLCHCLATMQTNSVPVIALIQEPWVTMNQVRGLSSLRGQILWGAPGEHVRTCIYISRNLDSVFLPHLSSKDATAVEVNLVRGQRKRAVVLASLYLPHDLESGLPPSNEMEQIVSFCEWRQKHLIIGCDANAHHTVWGCQDVNIRGQNLLDYLVTTD